MLPNREANTVINFGCCSVETLTHIPATQYSLHPVQDTIIHFTTIVNGRACEVLFIFHPFRRACNIIYHEYEIKCSIPCGMPEEGAYKHSIIEVAQQIYEIYFLKNARYNLALLDQSKHPGVCFLV
jgi:hypothetical protein